MQMMRVADVMAQAVQSCDVSAFDGSPEGWMELIRIKTRSVGFYALLDDILAQGEIQEAIGFRDGYIFEGHHRLVIAILTGMEWIPTSRDYRPSSWRVSAHSSKCQSEDWSFFA